jgi:hydrogenase maturation protease
MTRTLVIGVGNPDRGDDAVGIEVARRLRARGLSEASVCQSPRNASRLLESWQGRARVILIDAAAGAGRPGAIYRFEADAGPLPVSRLQASTHSWGVVEAVEMARSLGELPASLVVYAIEGTSFGPGQRLSPSVRRAATRVERRVLEEIGHPGSRAEGGE